jgi:hypothetical protein
MQNDLISRSALIEVLKNPSLFESQLEITIEDIISVIEELPCAYNVEKVVQELEEMSFEDICGRAILLHDAEPIVLNGGNE